nr:immunoglobulin light chain junction region [Macaca mulatta]MOX21640.1 immunoglobulin light chain junction region [Macaca mulatta]MOX23048.1 immunoglobulin light chain junction region [Macaca mulatta]
DYYCAIGHGSGLVLF